MSRGRAPIRASGEFTATEHESLRLWLRLLNCSSLVERQVRARLRGEFGITLPRFDLLAQLDAAAREGAKGLTMSELSRRRTATSRDLSSGWCRKSS